MALLVALGRLAELVIAALVIFWALHFRSSFVDQHSSPSSTSQLDHLYSVLHPLLMVIGFILLSSEAILAHRWLARWSRETRKSIHLSLQGAAFGFGLLGIWAKFRGERGLVANFYSLHSWLGLLCLSLFAAQWVVGCLSFWHRGEARRARETVLPWHVFLGLYTYGVAVATAETGLLEKLTFLQKKGRTATRSTETVVVNGLGLGLAFLCGVVVLAAVSQKHSGRTAIYSSKDHSSSCYSNGDGKNGNGYHQSTGTTYGKWKPHLPGQ